MNNLVTITNKNLEVKEFEGQRVVTFKEIDKLHERIEGTAKRNFNSNKSHFIENVDYFFVKPSDVEAYEIRTSEINNAGTYLITESGYLMLVKSLSDDLAWTVQRELVNKYFRVKIGQALTITEDIIEELREAKSYYKIQPKTVHEFTDYIKKRLNISKANEEFEQVKIMVFARLQINKWSDINLSERKSVLELIDNCVTKVKKERPYEQLSCFN